MFATPALALASVQELPEPETLALFGIGAVALMIARWRNKK
ncbi:MAG: PEP-CTERM sorting domain-containing protein [Betaproteobacteria bacterium]